MVNLSNPTTRVLDVLNFLAANPTEAFTLAEISRHLDISTPSAYRILTVMTEAHFLTRHPKHKTFALGMAPLAIGNAALVRHRGIEVALREISRLALELKLQCTIAAVVDDDVLLLAKEGTPQTHASSHRVGERKPIIPPIGIEHAAWGDEQEIQAYLAKASQHLSEPMLAHLQAALPVIRRRGYTVSFAGPAMRRLRQTAIQPIGQPRDEAYWLSVRKLLGELTAAEIQLLELHDEEINDISHIAAPVFSPAGTVAFVLIITGMPMNLSGKKIEEYAERLCTAAAVVTSETYGRTPKQVQKNSVKKTTRK